jgi:hypothetical protein
MGIATSSTAILHVQPVALLATVGPFRCWYSDCALWRRFGVGPAWRTAALAVHPRAPDAHRLDGTAAGPAAGSRAAVADQA